MTTTHAVNHSHKAHCVKTHCKRHVRKVHHFAATIALCSALLHASEHVLLYMEHFTAVRELLVVTRIVRE